nr:hypothetical protein [Tanacetum cinerariifolium]
MAMDEALVPNTQRLRIERSNFQLPSDIQSKESTLQLVYDVLRRCSFFKAFLITADVPEIYMQEFWATAYVHQHSIRFKMNNKKHIVNLKSFRDMLHISPRIPGQSFDELPFEEEIIKFIRDDFLFSTIKVVFRHQNTQQYGAMLPIELTNDEIRNTKAYKEYYAFTTGEAVPKPKVSARRKKSDSDTFITPPTATPTPKPTAAATLRLTAAAKGKQPAKATKAKSLSALSEVAMAEAEQLKLSSDDEGADDQGKDGDDDEGDEGDESDEGEEDTDEDKDGDERDDDEENQEVAKFNEKDDAEGGRDDNEESKSDEENNDEETRDEESFDPIPKTPESSKDKSDDEEDQGLNIGEEGHVDEEEEDNSIEMSILTREGQENSSVSSQFVTSMLSPSSDAGMESIFTTASSSLAPITTSTPIMTPSTIVTITTINQAPIPPTPISSEVLQNLPTFALVFHFEDRLKSLEANFFKYRQTNLFVEAVSAIPSIVDQYMNQQMNEAIRVAVQILTNRLHDSYERENDEFLQTINENMKRTIKESSHSSRTSYAVAADLSEMDLKKFLIEKMEGNKSIQRSDEQWNLYKALVEAYEANNIILDTYGETLQKPPTLDHDWNKTFPAVQGSTQTWISELAKQADTRSSFNELLDTSLDFSKFIMNWLIVDTLTPKILAGPTYELMKGSCRSLIELEYHLEEVYKATTDQLDWVNPKGQQYPHNLLQPLSLIPDNQGRHVIPFAHFINNDLEYLWGGASSRKYTTSVKKTKAADYGHIKWSEDLFYGFAVNRESALDVYSKRRIIAVTNLKIVEWHSYKHLDWISIRRDDDKIYKFKEGNFKRLRLQDIEDMLLLLGQGKLSNLTVEELESYQKRLNLTKPDTYRSDLKRRKVYTAYSNSRGFIYQNKDKKNRLIRIDELHKFSNWTLNDVRTTLDDHLKGIRMQYLPQTIRRKVIRTEQAAMIKAIDKMLKTRRIMRSLEKFVGGRLYEGDFRMLQRTI